MITEHKTKSKSMNIFKIDEGIELSVHDIDRSPTGAAARQPVVQLDRQRVVLVVVDSQQV
jgi:hypothetical protein